MKRPFDSIKEMISENLSRHRENTKFMFENYDKFMIWIVGFSIGGFSLIVSNLSQLDQTLNYCLIKIILILLTVSIISGIVYRIGFYVYQFYYQKIEFYIEGAFSTKELMKIEPDDLSNENDIKEVLRRLKDDFDEDLYYILNLYDQGDNNQKAFLLNDLKNHYKTIGEWAKKDFELSKTYTKSIYQKAFGLSDKKANKIFNEDNFSLKLKIWGWITTITFFLSCLSFITILIIFCATYHEKNIESSKDCIDSIQLNVDAININIDTIKQNSSNSKPGLVNSRKQ